MKRIIYSMLLVSAMAFPASAESMRTHLSPLQIQAIQQGLHDAGYYDAAPVDGLWGPVTTKAISSFQYNKGLEPTGYPDKKTLEKLGVNMPKRGQHITVNRGM